MRAVKLVESQDFVHRGGLAFQLSRATHDIWIPADEGQREHG
jgi:hypothetical protein